MLVTMKPAKTASANLDDALREVAAAAGDAFIARVDPTPVLATLLGPASHDPLANSGEFLSTASDGALYDAINSAANVILAAAIQNGGASLKALVQVQTARLAARPERKRAGRWLTGLRSAVATKREAFAAYVAGASPGPELAARAADLAHERISTAVINVLMTAGLVKDNTINQRVNDRLQKEPYRSSPDHVWQLAREADRAATDPEASRQFLTALVGDVVIQRAIEEQQRRRDPPSIGRPELHWYGRGRGGATTGGRSCSCWYYEGTPAPTQCGDIRCTMDEDSRSDPLRSLEKALRRYEQGQL